MGENTLKYAHMGERPRGMAQAMVPHSTPLEARGCVPLFLRDGDAHSRTALGTPCGWWVPPSRRQATGPDISPGPAGGPLPAVLYAPGVKTRRRRHRVAGKQRGVCGTNAALEQGRAAGGGRINHRLGGTAHSAAAATGGGAGTAQGHAVEEGRGVAQATGAVARGSAFCVAAGEAGPGPACARGHQRLGRCQGVAAGAASDGGGRTDRV